MRRILFAFTVTVIILSLEAGHVCSQGYEIDCEGTLKTWAIDPNMRKYLQTHNCTCPSSNRSPVCTPIGSSSTSSPSHSGPSRKSGDFKQEMMRNMMDSFTKGMEEGKRKRLEEDERRRREAEEAERIRQAQEKRRQEIFERNKQELLNAFKTGNQNTGLRLKGGGEELLDPPSDTAAPADIPVPGDSQQQRPALK